MITRQGYHLEGFSNNGIRQHNICLVIWGDGVSGAGSPDTREGGRPWLLDEEENIRAISPAGSRILWQE